MRLSADSSSPFWTLNALTAKVYLDGVPLAVVLEADEEAGWAEVLVRDAKGGVMVDESNPDDPRFMTKRLKGTIKIEVEP